MVFLIASPKCIDDAEGSVRLERQGGDPVVVPGVCGRGDIVGAVEVEGRGGRGDRVGVVVDAAVLHVTVTADVDDAGTSCRGGNVRRRREPQPAAAATEEWGVSEL